MAFTIQKADLWKRMSALLFDLILTATLAIGFAAAISTLFGYSGYTAQLQARYEYYETEYGVIFDLPQEEYEKLSEAEKATLQEANKALLNDKEAQQLYKLLFFMTLAIFSLSGFLAILIWQFLIPLFFKNGQTLGKKIFGTCVVRTNGVKASNPVLFIRAMIGSFAIETMFPCMILIMLVFGLIGGVGTITLLLFYGLQLFVILSSKTNSAIHDLLCDTIVVDFASQVIFQSEDERAAYIQAQENEQEQALENAPLTNSF